jgi:hypothetical protein
VKVIEKSGRESRPKYEKGNEEREGGAQSREVVLIYCEVERKKITIEERPCLRLDGTVKEGDAFLMFCSDFI